MRWGSAAPAPQPRKARAVGVINPNPSAPGTRGLQQPGSHQVPHHHAPSSSAQVRERLASTAGATRQYRDVATALLRSRRFWVVAMLLTLCSRIFVSVTHDQGSASHLGGLLSHGKTQSSSREVTDAWSTRGAYRRPWRAALKDVDVYGPGVEDLEEGDVADDNDAIAHPTLTSSSRLLDYVSFNANGDGHKRSRNARAPSDVGVRGQTTLPRGNHRAWVSRIAADVRPSHRYKHMAAVARLGSRFVVAWQASAVYEGHSDQRIYHTFSRDSQGTAWGPEHTIPAIEKGTPQWSPVLHVDEAGGRIVLFYSESQLCIRPPPGPDEGNPQGIFGPRHLPGGDIKMTVMKIGEPGPDLFKDYSWLRSVRWEPPKTILAQGTPGMGFGPVPKVIANPMIVLSSGEWLLPYWREPHEAAPCEKNHSGSSGVLRSRDGGATWRAHGQLQNQRTWLIENTLVERSDGAVLMLFRTKVGALWKSVSYDKGKTWAEAVPTAIPNPDSKIQMLRLLSGHLALVLNSHAKLKVNRKARTFLDVAVSADEGLSWNRIARLEDDFAPGVRAHYPTAVADETRVVVVYSKFFFGPHLDTALANSTAMGIRMKTVDVARLPTVDHGDPSRVTASDTGGATALLTAGLGSVFSVVAGGAGSVGGDVDEVGEDGELDDAVGGSGSGSRGGGGSGSGSLAAQAGGIPGGGNPGGRGGGGGGGRHSSRRNGGGHGGGNGGAQEEVAASRQQGRGRGRGGDGQGLPPNNVQQPLLIDDLQAARAKFEALQRESARLDAEHNKLVQPTIVRKQNA